MFFIQYTLQDQASKFFPVLYMLRLQLKFCHLTVNRYTSEYIPHRELWLNRLYFEISNSSTKQCFTIDARDVNKLGSSKFRTGAENDKEQVCYFNYNKKDRVFNRFLAVRKRTPDREMGFSIVSLINRSNNSEDIYYKLGDELSKFKDGKL